MRFLTLEGDMATRLKQAYVTPEADVSSPLQPQSASFFWDSAELLPAARDGEPKKPTFRLSQIHSSVVALSSKRAGKARKGSEASEP